MVEGVGELQSERAKARASFTFLKILVFLAQILIAAQKLGAEVGSGLFFLAKITFQPFSPVLGSLGALLRDIMLLNLFFQGAFLLLHLLAETCDLLLLILNCTDTQQIVSVITQEQQAGRRVRTFVIQVIDLSSNLLATQLDGLLNSAHGCNCGDVHDELEHFLEESDNGVSKNSAWAASELRKEDVGSSEVKAWMVELFCLSVITAQSSFSYAGGIL